MSKLSLAEAAAALEYLCEHIESLESLDAEIQNLFSEAHGSLKDCVDRRIKFLKYAESQVMLAKQMRDEWAKRALRFETAIERIKANTIAVMKANPDVPYKGDLGAFKIQKNSVPVLEMPEDWDKDPTYFIEKRYLSLDKEKLKADLKAGKEIPGVSLRYGEHLRMSI